MKIVNADGWTDSAKQDIGKTGTIVDYYTVGTLKEYEIKFDEPEERVVGYRRYTKTGTNAHEDNIELLDEKLERE